MDRNGVCSDRKDAEGGEKYPVGSDELLAFLRKSLSCNECSAKYTTAERSATSTKMTMNTGIRLFIDQPGFFEETLYPGTGSFPAPVPGYPGMYPGMHTSR